MNRAMEVVKGIARYVLASILVVLTIIAVFYVTAGIGYLAGMLLAALPFISGWLTASLPITAEQIPGIVAWLSVAGMFIGGAKVVSNAGKE